MKQTEKSEPVTETESQARLGLDCHAVVVEAHLLDRALQLVLRKNISFSRTVQPGHNDLELHVINLTW